MRTRNAVFLAGGAVAVALAGFLIGWFAGPGSSPSVPTPAPEPQASAPATTDSPPRSGTASASEASNLPMAARNFLRFELSRRNVKAILADGPTVWIGTSGGLIKFDPTSGGQTVFDNKSGLLSNGVFYLGKFGGEIWVGTYGGGLSVLNTTSGAWRNYNIPDGMADAFVYDVLRARNGDVWIATWSGANRIVGGQIDKIESWQLYTVDNTGGGLPNDWVYGLAEGKNGEIWFATEGGLARFQDGRWQRWKHEDGLGASYETVKSDIQFQSDPGEVSAHHARQKAEQGLRDVTVAYNPNYIVSLAVDREGRVWAGTWGGGLSRFDGQAWATFTVSDGLPANHVFALEVDAAGTLWVGTSRGLAKREGDGFTVFGVHDGLISDAVFSIGFEGDSALWVGSYGGLTWFPHGPVRAQR